MIELAIRRLRNWSIPLVTAIVLLSTSNVEAQQGCAAPRGGGGGTAAGGAGGGNAGGGGAVLPGGGGTSTGSAAAPGSTPFLIQEFFMLQQSRARDLMNGPSGRGMNMSVRGIAPRGRAVASRGSKPRQARKDKTSLRRRRQIALELNSERTEEARQAEPTEPDESNQDEPANVASDPEAIPAIFRQ